MKHSVIRKAYLVVIALLVLGQSLFGGGGSGSGFRQRVVNRPGFVGPGRDAFVYAFSRMCSYVPGPGNYWDVLRYLEHSNEEEAEEDVFPIGDLPPEVIAGYIFPYLGNEDLADLALTSRRMAELARKELRDRHTAQRIHAIIQRAPSPSFLIRNQVAQTISELFVSSEISLRQEQVELLLTLLLGGDARKGLVEDEDRRVRWHVVWAIGRILTLGKCSEWEHSRLLDALIGENGYGGLARRILGAHAHKRVAENIGTILALGKCNQNEYPRVLNTLIGDNDYEGLAGAKNKYVRMSVAEAIGKILASGRCREEEHSRLLDALDQLANDPEPIVLYEAQDVKETEAIHSVYETQAALESAE